METRKLVALGVALVVSGAGVLAGQDAGGCEPVGEIQFICDLIGPEDLAIVPGDEWVVVSGNQEGGRIHLINVADKTTSVLFPTADRVERLDAATYPSCPGPPRGGRVGPGRVPGARPLPETGGGRRAHAVRGAPRPAGVDRGVRARRRRDADDPGLGRLRRRARGAAAQLGGRAARGRLLRDEHVHGATSGSGALRTVGQ